MAQSTEGGKVQFGAVSARLGPARPGLPWPGSARFGPAGLGSARLVPARPGSAPLGLAQVGLAFPLFGLGSAELGPSCAKKVRKRVPAAQCINCVIHCKKYENWAIMTRSTEGGKVWFGSGVRRVEKFCLGLSRPGPARLSSGWARRASAQPRLALARLGSAPPDPARLGSERFVSGRLG